MYNPMFKNNTSYLVTSIALSKKEPFTWEQVSSELTLQGINANEGTVKRRLTTLRNVGILIEQGSYYSLAI